MDADFRTGGQNQGQSQNQNQNQNQNQRKQAFLFLALAAVLFVLPSLLPKDERLSGKILVAQAMPGGDYFSGAEIFLLRHDVFGAYGAVLNRPLEPMSRDAFIKRIGAERLLQKAGVFAAAAHASEAPAAPAMIFEGGPLSGDEALVLRTRRGADMPRGFREVAETGIYFSQQKKAAVHCHMAADGCRIYLGYAGWGPGQLEREIAKGLWQVRDAAADTLFPALSGEMRQNPPTQSTQ